MNKEIKISIKNRWTGSILFEYSSVDNTLAKTVTEALKGDANLSDANLSDANLSGANLCGAYLRNAYLRNAYLRNAYLRGADLRNADLRNADLCNADLCNADLRGAYLRNADLRNADLCDADLRGADLRGANLCGADLRNACLRGAYLRNADLCDAYLCDAYLCDAYLCDAYLRGVRGAYIACPTDGSFIGWKKASGYIVKLQIPEDARRSSAGGEKCRCDKAYVVEIQNADGTKADIETVHSNHDANFVYTVGATVEVSDFDGDRWNECAPGIHFFIDRRAAVEH